MRLLANLLRERVVLQEPTRTTDALGGGAITYVTRQTRWAQVIAASASGAFAEDRRANVRRYVVSLRAPCSVSRDWRLLWRGVPLRVEAVEEPSPLEVRLACIAEEAQP